MSFAECDKLDLTATEEQLCDPRAPGDRPGVNYYVWNKSSPGAKFPGPAHDNVLQGFATKAMRGQAGDYALVIAREVGAYFAPGRPVPAHTMCHTAWVLPYTAKKPGCYAQPVARADFRVEGGQPPQAWGGAAAALNAYQTHGGYTPGPLLALCVLAALAALVLRPRGGRGWRQHLDIVALVGTGLALLVVAVATSQFDYRYGLPALAFLPAGGALAVTALTGRRTRGRAPLDDAIEG
jgi:hypothetical protein